MACSIRSLWLIIGLLALRALAQCSSYGVDYVNGGSYDIDSSSNNNFTFTTIFQGCDQESVTPILIDPSGGQHSCSAVDTTPAGQQVTSTCEIEYSAMSSGLYKIIIQGASIGVQRTIALTAGTPSTITFTATPTVIIGVTSTPNATTVYKTIEQTQTVTLKPGTVKAPCDGITQTVTITPVAPTVTTIYTITRTITDQKTTSHSTTTVTKTASCHYLPTLTLPVPDPTPTICIGLACLPPIIPPGLIGNPGVAISDTALETSMRGVAAVESLAVTTITVTETTVTITSTSFTTVPAETTTEDVYQTITATITPPPTTVCDDERPPSTITITRPVGVVTQTDVSYDTTHIKPTVWIGETRYTTSTDKASATSCMNHGGWYGADEFAPTATAS